MEFEYTFFHIIFDVVKSAFYRIETKKNYINIHSLAMIKFCLILKSMKLH